MAAIQIKVQPHEMKIKASQVSGEVKQIEAQWRKLRQTVKNSRTYWQGDASDRHQKYLKDVTDDVERILRRLKEHPDDLMKMAGIYEKAESTAGALGGKLPNDVI